MIKTDRMTPEEVEEYFNSSVFKKILRSLKKCHRCGEWYRKIGQEKICQICQTKRAKTKQHQTKWKKRKIRWLKNGK